ncbi:MAG: hypothetical protein VX453_08180 [Acidobacteriota bacterium]|nr:hypothetical protein [Acidobacteriota bacterium]
MGQRRSSFRASGQLPWLRYTALGSGVLVATLLVVSLIYFGVDALVGRDQPADSRETAAVVTPNQALVPAVSTNNSRLRGGLPADSVPSVVRRPERTQPVRRSDPVPSIGRRNVPLPAREADLPTRVARTPPRSPAPADSTAVPVPQSDLPASVARTLDRPSTPSPPPEPVGVPVTVPRPVVAAPEPAGVPVTAPRPVIAAPALAEDRFDLLISVVDPEAKILSNVALTLSPGSLTADTNERGEWLFEGLAPGIYDITASLETYYPFAGTVDVDAGRARDVARTETIELVSTNIPAREEQARLDIGVTLEGYRLAFERLDAASLLTVFPSAPIEGIQTQFDRIEDYETYEFTPPEFMQLDVVEGTATVQLELKRKFELKVGGTQEPDDVDAEFVLTQQTEGEPWLISEVQYFR